MHRNIDKMLVTTNKLPILIIDLQSNHFDSKNYTILRVKLVSHYLAILIYPKNHLKTLGDQKLENSFSSSGSKARTAFQSVSGYSSKLDVSPSYDTEGTIGGWKGKYAINILFL